MRKKGFKHSEEYKKRMSEKMKGRPGYFKGHKHSEESRKKISILHTGKKKTKEHRNKLRISLLGHIVSTKTRKKISLKCKGRKHSKETIKKMKQYALRGNKNPACRPEIRQKLRQKALERVINGTHNFYKQNNPLWNNGSSFEPYSVDWTQTLRRSIRERDKYTCQLCSKQQGDIVHHIHHIDYDKKNSNPDNLITLCNKCHSKTNNNRELWIIYFQIFNQIKL